MVAGEGERPHLRLLSAEPGSSRYQCPRSRTRRSGWPEVGCQRRMPLRCALAGRGQQDLNTCLWLRRIRWLMRPCGPWLGLLTDYITAAFHCQRKLAGAGKSERRSQAQAPKIRDPLVVVG